MHSCGLFSASESESGPAAQPEDNPEIPSPDFACKNGTRPQVPDLHCSLTRLRWPCGGRQAAGTSNAELARRCRKAAAAGSATLTRLHLPYAAVGLAAQGRGRCCAAHRLSHKVAKVRHLRWRQGCLETRHQLRHSIGLTRKGAWCRIPRGIPSCTWQHADAGAGALFAIWQALGEYKAHFDAGWEGQL